MVLWTGNSMVSMVNCPLPCLIPGQMVHWRFGQEFVTPSGKMYVSWMSVYVNVMIPMKRKMLFPMMVRWWFWWLRSIEEWWLEYNRLDEWCTVAKKNWFTVNIHIYISYLQCQNEWTYVILMVAASSFPSMDLCPFGASKSHQYHLPRTSVMPVTKAW